MAKITVESASDIFKKVYGGSKYMHLSQNALLKISKKKYLKEKDKYSWGDLMPYTACGIANYMDAFGPCMMMLVECFFDDKTLEPAKNNYGKPIKITCPGCIDLLKKEGL